MGSPRHSGTRGSATLSVRAIALAVGIAYYVGAWVIFRDVLTSIPAVLRGDAVIVGDELVPYFNPSSQLFEQAQGEFSELTNGYEFRVRYSFLTTWLRYYKILPFAILIVLPAIVWATYLTTARFIDRVFTTLPSQAVYLATAFPTAMIYLIMTYAKITHFYTLILGLAMFTASVLWLLYGLLFETSRWRWYAVLASVVALLNPAVHYLVLFVLVFALTVATLLLGELARWIRLGGPRRLGRVARVARRLVTRRGRRRKLRRLYPWLAGSVAGRCAGAGLIVGCVALVPYALFVKFLALRGVPNLSETVPGDYYVIRDTSVSWLHVLSWDLAGITDKLLFGDYLAKVPRSPNLVYSLLLVVPLAVPFVRRLFATRAHRQLLAVIYVQVAFAVWATIGYAQPVWLPTFHRAMAALAGAAAATDSPAGSWTLTVTSTVVQVLRFPHRFQLILFMLAPLLMSLTLAVALDRLTGRWLEHRAGRRPDPTAATVLVPPRRRVRAGLVIQLVAVAWVAALFFAPLLSNQPYRKVFGSGDFGGFLVAYPVGDLRELKQVLKALPEGRTVVLPPAETAKLVVDDNGMDHKFIDKFYIYYLDMPSVYYGLTGDVRNKFEFFLILRGIYYEQDWWINVARDIDLRYIVVNRKLRDNRGVGAEYLPDVESYVEPSIRRLDEDLRLRFQNDSYALYELTDRPQDGRQTMLVDSSWPSYLNLMYTRLDLSRCYDFAYLPYYDPPPGQRPPLLVTTDDKHAAAVDLYLLSRQELIARPDSRIFAFNPGIVPSSYYLSPMFRAFLLHSNNEWNRAEVITPGVFGTLRGSFVGVPRATRFDVPATFVRPGRYRVLMRAAATANTVEVLAGSLGYQRSAELRSPPQNLQMFDVDDVYTPDRVPVDTSRLSVAELQRLISDRLVPVNAGFAYHDLGTVVATAGRHTFSVRKTDSNPMLVEGLMFVPEEDYRSLALPPEVTVVDDPDTLGCSEQTPGGGPADRYRDPEARDAHEDLSEEELVDLAASGVEEIAPNTSGGLGASWLNLGAVMVMLVAGGLLVWQRSRSPERSDP